MQTQRFEVIRIDGVTYGIKDNQTGVTFITGPFWKAEIKARKSNKAGKLVK